MKVGFLGAGNMGSALIKGSLDSGFLKPGQCSVFDVDRGRVKSVSRECGVKTASFCGEAVSGSDYVFLCVKPQQMAGLLSDIGGILKEKQCLISIAAGVKTSFIESNILRPIPVIRVMPNTPAMIRCGMSAVCKGKYATDRHARFALDFFSSVGKAIPLDERHLDAVTAVSGSGPAYVFYLAEFLERAAVCLGLPEKAAELLSRQTILGAGKMLDGSISPLELRARVTSPGGTTEAAVRHLEKKKWGRIFVAAVQEARNRSRELSGG